MALNMAAKLGVDTAGLAGTGAGTGTGGRVTVEDVVAAHARLAPGVPASADDELPALEVGPDEAEVEEASFRLKTQARRVTASKHVIPHFYLTRAVNVTALLGRKAEFKERHKASVTHLIMLAAVKALGKHADMNRSYDHGRVIRWKSVNLGIAIATDAGLNVAVLRGAEGLDLARIAERTRELVEKARAGKLSSEERSHPTFTITNLGMYDVEHFQPIINPPSAVTMGVSSALEEAVVSDGEVKVGRVMRLTLSCDHRIVEGAAAAEFLGEVRRLLEAPDELLA